MPTRKLSKAQREHMAARRKMTGKNLPQLAQGAGKAAGKAAKAVRSAVSPKPKPAPAKKRTAAKPAKSGRIRTNAEINAQIDANQRKIDALARKRRR